MLPQITDLVDKIIIELMGKLIELCFMDTSLTHPIFIVKCCSVTNALVNLGLTLGLESSF